jgi:hypothetical protein
MPIDRRRLLRGGTALAGAVALPNFARAKVRFAPQSGTWRYFEVVTRVDILEPSGATQAWVPVPAVNERDWFKSLGSEWTSNGDASFAHDPKYGAEMLHVEWPDGDSPVVEVPSRIATRDRAIDFAKPGRPAALTAAEHKFHTRDTELIPVDGIVKRTSDKIITDAGADRDREGARRLRVDCGQHLPRCRGTRLWHRRHCGDAQDGQSRRQMRRSERALCRFGAGGWFTGARCLRRPDCAVEIRLQESAPRELPKHNIAARSSILPASAGRRWTRPMCARSCSRNRQPTWRPTVPRLLPRERRQLAGAQLRPRRHIARIERPKACLPDVYTDRERERATRLPRPE